MLMLNGQEEGGGIFEALNGHIYGNQSNPTLVLSHGLGTDQTVWHHLVPTLSCFFKVVVFDLAFSPNVRSGFYDPIKYSNFTSFADDLICVLDELHIERAVYLGHSMPAMIGCLAAAQKPNLFQHLILLGGSPRYLNTEGYDGGLTSSDIDSILDQMNHNYSDWAPAFARKTITVNDTRAITELEQSLLRMDPKITLSVAETVFLSDQRWVLPQVRVPSTIVQTEVDVIVPEMVTEYMKSQLGGCASLEILPTEGHFPHLTAPHLLLSVLKRVMGVDGSTGSGSNCEISCN